MMAMGVLCPTAEESIFYNDMAMVGQRKNLVLVINQLNAQNLVL